MNKQNWWEFWFPEVEKIAREYGEYRYPLAEKQDTNPNNGYHSSVEFKSGYWWQTIYDCNLNHAPIIEKRYPTYIEAVEDFSIYPNPETAEFSCQAQFY